MDSERFDRIARTWATSSRRRLLGVLAAGTLTTLLPHRAGAACQEGDVEQHPCGTRECIGGQFVNFFESADTVCRPAAGECDAAEFCTGSSFPCPSDRKRPNGSACSSDGDVCTNDICQNGQCVHVANAAACADDGNVCTDDVCAGGICTHPAKPYDTSCPDGACCGGQCIDTGTDEAHCGACNRVCGVGKTCCKGKCANLNNDERNCGKCGKRCRRGQTCRRGRCR